MSLTHALLLSLQWLVPNQLGGSYGYIPLTIGCIYGVSGYLLN